MLKDVKLQVPKAVCVVEPLTTSFDALPGPTVKLSRSEPVDEIVPSVADTTAVSALKSASVREPVETPLVNVMDVAVPNAVAFTVGEVAGFADAFAPLKVTDFAPV